VWADVTDLAFVHIKNPSADVDIDILYVYWYWFNEIISHYMAFICYKKWTLIMEMLIIWHNFINYTFGLFDSVLHLENMEIAHPSMVARVLFTLMLPIL
jgi:hypothetical protein